jgi:hypothetical protein
MPRSWKILVPAVLTALAVASAARADNPEFPKTDSEKLTEILRQLHNVQDRLDRVEANQTLQIRGMQDDIARLKDDLARLREQTARLDQAQTRISASINPDRPPAGLVTGTIRLENRHSAPATFVINGRQHRLMPLEVRPVTETAGKFTYEVYTDDFGLIQRPVDRFLEPTRTFPITVNP